MSQGRPSHDESQDAVISRMQPDVRTGRKWEAEKATEEAIASAQFREIQGITPASRQGIGCSRLRTRFWSKESAMGRRELVKLEVQASEEHARWVTAAQQSQQGAWTSWEGVEPRKLSWDGL